MPDPREALLTYAAELRHAVASLPVRAQTGWHTVGLPWNDGVPYVVAGDPDPHVGSFICDPENQVEDLPQRERSGVDEIAAFIALRGPGDALQVASMIEAACDAALGNGLVAMADALLPGWRDAP